MANKKTIRSDKTVSEDARNPDPFLVFGAPQIAEAEIEEVQAVLRSGWLGTGPRVAQFEQSFATYKGRSAAHAAAVNSCTAALHVSMVAAGLLGAGAAALAGADPARPAKRITHTSL